MKSKQIYLTLASSLLLASCGYQKQVAVPSSSTPHAHHASDQVKPTSYEYALKVSLTQGDTPEKLAAKYLGKVLDFAPERKEAIIGLSADQAQQLQLNVAATAKGAVLSSQGLSNLSLEKNHNAFQATSRLSIWSGGRLSIWSGGRLSIWSGGRLSIWSGGDYGLDQNNQAWQQISLKAAQKLAPNLGNGVKVAVLDTGIDQMHSAFGGSIDSYGGWDFVDEDANPQEEGVWGVGAFGHGTNVAGIILQVAPHAQIVPMRVLDSNGQGDAVNVARAIYRATRINGLRVIHMSLGSSTYSKVVQDALTYATNKGILVVASSGNTGDGQVTYPAHDMSQNNYYGHMSTSVGSVNSSGHKSVFSSYGSTSAPVDIMAPGEDIYAPSPNEKMASWTGTSMAAPMITGAYTLALSHGTAASHNSYPAWLAYKTTRIDNLAANAPFRGKIGNLLNIESFLNGIGILR